LGGNGDVCISYENEAITAQQKGADVDYVIPDQTLLIQNPIAVTSAAKPQAKAFVDYALSKPAQEIFAKHGYRPVDSSVAAGKFPTPKDLFTIDSLGGWAKGNDEVFDPDKGAVAAIENEAGGAADKQRRRLAPAGRPRPGAGARDHHGLAVGDRPDPARRGGRKGDRGVVLAHRHDAACAGGAGAVGRRIAGGRGGERGLRHADRVGAGARPVRGTG